ncbi:hypothetical protein ACSFA0_24935 [Variovorax sp. LT1P1]|uniref:hypothetical protein n=1 Tax=Variovorax sp. LT1P1 TaxID=3443730 RepID=UPI003F4577A7
MTCFETCSCVCGEASFAAFDKVAEVEMAKPPLLREIVHAEIGWFMARSFEDPTMNSDNWGLGKRSGVYLLWWKDDYCAIHDRFHMRSLYAGKGFPLRRFLAHYEDKDFEEQMLVYWTFFPCKNRIAKYLEQLLLDTYKFQFNKSENPGRELLCASFTQCEVD